MFNKTDYEQKALLYAEKHGIIEYEVIKGNIMNYYEEINEGEGILAAYNVKLNLDTMEEQRIRIK